MVGHPRWLDIQFPNGNCVFRAYNMSIVRVPAVQRLTPVGCRCSRSRGHRFRGLGCVRTKCFARHILWHRDNKSCLTWKCRWCLESLCYPSWCNLVERADTAHFYGTRHRLLWRSWAQMGYWVLVFSTAVPTRKGCLMIRGVVRYATVCSRGRVLRRVQRAVHEEVLSCASSP
jgi:hypothetical protein